MKSKEIADRFTRGTMPREQVELLYRLRDEEIEALSAKSTITAADVLELERGGRFKVADTLWHQCTTEARLLLLADPSPGVRSTARISAGRVAADTHLASAAETTSGKRHAPRTLSRAAGRRPTGALHDPG